jgi:hypothetical protein
MEFHMKKFIATATTTVLLFLVPALATEKPSAVPGFSAGNYELTEGEEHLCGEGKFYVSDDGSRLWLGPYYSFRTKPGIVTEKGGLPGDKGCVYQSDTKFSVKGGKTIFTDVTTLLCGQNKRQIITNEATIIKHTIILNQSTWVDPAFYYHAGGTPHHCTWKKLK